ITLSPLFGYGFGTQFRAYNIIAHFHTWMGFSHNSYLYIIFKSGLVGGFLFIVSTLIFLVMGLQVVRSTRLSVQSRAVARICLAFLVVFLIGAYIGPAFDSKTGVSLMGLTWGAIITLHRKDRW